MEQFWEMRMGFLASLFGSKEEQKETAEEVATKRCPFCAETLHINATFCHCCGRELPKE
jgi:hypothetical protein